jgi:hypothetical protein
MPGPTTEVLNEDIKDLKVEIRDFKAEFRLALDLLHKEYHHIGVELAELRGELKVTFRIARWASALLVTSILTSGAAGLWWASRVDAKVDILGERLDERSQASSARMDERLKGMDARFDRLESLIVKAIDQGQAVKEEKKTETRAAAPVK